MCTQNIHTCRDRFFTNLEKGNALMHLYSIYLVTFADFALGSNDVSQIAIACFLCHADGQINTFTFCFALIQAVLIALADSLQLFFVFVLVGKPEIFFFHMNMSMPFL